MEKKKVATQNAEENKINKQLEEGVEANTFKKLIADKETILSQINNNNKLVEQQKEIIQTTKFVTTTEKLNAQSKLSKYIKNHFLYLSLHLVHVVCAGSRCAIVIL